MNIIIRFMYIVSCIFVICSIIRVLYRQRELAYVNPIFLMNIYSFCYLSLPCLFTEEISYYWNWNLTESSIIYTRFLLGSINIMNAILLLLIKKVKIKPSFFSIKHNNIIKIVYFCIFSYLFVILLNKIISNELFTYSNYGLKVYNDYKLKNISYFLLTFSILAYFETSNILCFLPNLIAAFIELCSGARTLSFIACVPLFLCVAIKNKKTYILPLILFSVLFLCLGLIRSAIVQDYNKPFYLNVIGEFREVYITLPLFIENNEFYCNRGTWIDLSGAIIGGLVPSPLRDYIFKNTIKPATVLVSHIKRGYGLASNYLINSLFFGGYSFMLISHLFLILVAFIFLLLINNSNEKYACLLSSFYLVFTRLSFREGIFANYSLMLFIMFFYGLPAYLIVNKGKAKEFLNKLISKRLSNA